MPLLLRHFLQPLMSGQIVFLSLLKLCFAQIPNSDIGNYPSGVLTLLTASWLFFGNSTSTLYGVLPQYWLMPSLQTARKQYRDDLRRVKCCEKDCYNRTRDDVIAQAEGLRKKFMDRGINLEEASKKIVASGCWSFSIFAEASDEEVKRGFEIFLASPVPREEEQHWLSEFRRWEEDVNAGSQRFWVFGRVSTPTELLNKGVVVKTVDAITVRVGSRRRTLDVRSVASLLTHSVAAAAARDVTGCVVFEAMLISIWAGIALMNAHDVPARQWTNPVLVPASTLKLKTITPPRGSNVAYEPIEIHGLWIYIVLITVARVAISSATALGSSGSLWFAVFTGLYLTNSSAAGSFGREHYDARADSGLMSGEGFYMNFSRGTMTTHTNFHDRLESVSVFLSLLFVIVVRLFKLKLRSLLGYGAWVPSAPWQMVPGTLLSLWASLSCFFELIENLDRKRPELLENMNKERQESKDVKFILYKAFIVSSCFACFGLGLASVTTAYLRESSLAASLRWAAYGVAEFHSWNVVLRRFIIGKVDGPDMWFANTSILAAMWGAAILAVAADPGNSLL